MSPLSIQQNFEEFSFGMAQPVLGSINATEICWVPIFHFQRFTWATVEIQLSSLCLFGGNLKVGSCDWYSSSSSSSASQLVGSDVINQRQSTETNHCQQQGPGFAIAHSAARASSSTPILLQMRRRSNERLSPELVSMYTGLYVPRCSLRHDASRAWRRQWVSVAMGYAFQVLNSSI